MKREFTVWTGAQDSNRVKAFRSALLLRRKESWRWVNAPDQANLWVLDDNFPLEEYVELYNDTANKPAVAIITPENCTSTPSCTHPQQWQHIHTPISVNLIFKWLDTAFSGAQAEDNNNNNDSVRPWLTQNFKLSAWPDVSKYSSSSNVVLICSKLLNGYHSYQSVLAWGIDRQTLNHILSDAYKHSIIDIQPELPPEQNTSGSVARPDKNKSLIQKLLGRFV